MACLRFEVGAYGITVLAGINLGGLVCLKGVWRGFMVVCGELVVQRGKGIPGGFKGL